METGDVYACAVKTLRAIGTAASGLNVELPDRQTVSAGGAVFDCPMVAVSILNVGTGIPDQAPTGQNLGASTYPFLNQAIWNVTLQVSIARAAQERPDGTRGERPPKLAWIDADAQAASGDVAVLIEACRALIADWGSLQLPVTVGQTEGGIFATVLTATVPLW